MGTSRQGNTGFTLLEVLVALAVLALALAAALKVAAENTENNRYLRDKTFAHWIAANKLTEMQLFPDRISPGESRGQTEMAQRLWYWRLIASDLPGTAIKRLDVSIYAQADDEQALTRLSGFSDWQKPAQ